jgi:hypothetical protein
MKVEDPRGPVSKSFTEIRKKTASRLSSIFSLLDYQRGGCFRGVFGGFSRHSATLDPLESPTSTSISIPRILSSTKWLHLEQSVKKSETSI